MHHMGVTVPVRIIPLGNWNYSIDKTSPDRYLTLSTVEYASPGYGFTKYAPVKKVIIREYRGVICKDEIQRSPLGKITYWKDSNGSILNNPQINKLKY